ncbi:MAG: class I SAM-dependent methyltransferase [Acidobacteriaceae bacterium]|nr:class I SAM-dependent methyltransferase [Acidobacteriaceae bacterium]
MDITCERLILGKFSALTENEHLARYRFAEQFVEGKQVADIACGTGYGTILLAKGGAKDVQGMDISEEAVVFSQENCNTPNVCYVVANAQKLTAISDNRFDVVVSFETIEHLPNVEAYLDEMVRILRPGGKFLVSTPDRRIASVLHCFLGHPQNPYHICEYTERELISLLSTRFRIETCYGQGFVPRWLVFWPIQFIIKAACRCLGTTKAHDFRNNLYSNWGNVKVVPKGMRSDIPKFWVIACTRP